MEMMKFSPNQLFLLVLAVVSIVFSTASLLSDLAPLGRMSETLILSLTITKAALYDTFNITRLLFRLPQKNKRMFFHATTTPVPQEQEGGKKKKPFTWRSSRFRQCSVEILDDTVGAIPAALAVSAFNASRAGESFFINDTTAMTWLVLMAFVVKLLRLLHEMFLIFHRHRHYKLQLPTIAINCLGIIASLVSLCHLVLFELLVQDIVTATDYIWFLPVMHLPIMKKDKNAQKAWPEHRNVQQYLYGTS